MDDRICDTETYTAKDFIVYFDMRELTLIEEMTRKLQEKLSYLLSFFKLEKLKKPVNIYVYSDRDKYINHILKYTGRYHDWMIADAYDGNINILSLQHCKMAHAHKKMIFSEWVQCCIKGGMKENYS